MTKTDESILNVDVSKFENANSTKPDNINLLDWLKTDRYKNEVLAIRQNPDKKDRNKLKKLLPAITPAGIFSQRSSKALIKHSGFIPFDIDGIKNPEIVKADLSRIENIAYIGLSVSGRGLWGLIPIAHPEKHKQHFDFVLKAFAGMGIVADPANKDLSRLRFCSYDPNPYFNHKAAILKKYLLPTVKTRSGKARQGANFEDSLKHVETCLKEIEARKLDITAAYNDWLSIGYGFAYTFGEAGRDLFHRVSQFYPKYSEDESDKVFTNVLKDKRNQTDLAPFFETCKKRGIRYTLIEDFGSTTENT